MGETVKNVNNYPEGIEILAEKMDLPIPKEDMEARRQAVIAFIMGISSL